MLSRHIDASIRLLSLLPADFISPSIFFRRFRFAFSDIFFFAFRDADFDDIFFDDAFYFRADDYLSPILILLLFFHAMMLFIIIYFLISLSFRCRYYAWYFIAYFFIFHAFFHFLSPLFSRHLMRACFSLIFSLLIRLLFMPYIAFAMPPFHAITPLIIFFAAYICCAIAFWLPH